jgi:plastocyanin
MHRFAEQRLPEEETAVRVLFSIIAGATLALAAAACGGSPAPTTGTTASVGPTPAGCSGSGGDAVSIANLAFNPISIAISAGGTVTWTNNDNTTHTVTFDAGPDCGRVSVGATVSRTFDTVGTFTYHCTIHPSMKGTVVVE